MRMAVIKASRCRRRAVRGDPARAGRDSHSCEPRRTGRTVSRTVRTRAPIRRAGGDRRAVPVGLHAGADDDTGGADLRDPPRGAGISRRAVDRPPRPDVCGAGSLARGGGSLSGAGAGMDRPPRRIDVAAVAVARARTRRDLSAVQVGLRRVGKGALRAVPTILAPRHEWWARFRLRSSSYGGQVALPTLRSSRTHISSFGQFTIQGMPNLSTHMPKPLEKKVLPNGIRTVPPSASALKRRSASAGSSTASATEKPCG